MRCVTCGNVLADDAAFCPRCGTHQPGAPVYDNYRYAAFVSYRHLPYDAKIARRVQRGIEAYRLPRGIEAPAVAGAGGRRLGRVFRDEEELSAAGSLPAKIRDALKASRTLVVVCSKATAQSAWVTQEVELFASYHGRECILVALAEGEVRDVAPHLLLDGGEGRSKASEDEPMAADFRLEARRRFRSELLRLVAGIVGCGYDDLRRRERRRHRRRVAGLAAGVAAVAVVVGVTGWQAAQRVSASQAEALANESRTLAAQSEQQLAAGDRYGAIETALSALPSDADPGRPVTDEAKGALEDALEVKALSADSWRPSYMLEMPDDVRDWGAPEGAEWFYLRDSERNIRFYDTITGHVKAQASLPSTEASQADGSEWILPTCTSDSLIVALGHDRTARLLSIDASTGDVRWSIDDMPLDGACAFEDQLVAVLSILDNGDLQVSMLDASSGTVLDTFTFEGLELPIDADYPRCMFGTTAADLYVMCGDQLRYVNLDTGEVHRAATALPNLSSANFDYLDGALMTISTGEVGGSEQVSVDYAVEAFSPALDRLWSEDGAYAKQYSATDQGLTLVNGWPSCQGPFRLEDGTSTLVCTVGSQVMGYALETGERLFTYDAPATVINVGDTVHESLLAVFSADGSLSFEDPSGIWGGSLGSAFDMRFPDSLYSAQELAYEGPYRVAMGISLSDKNRMYVYHSDYTASDPDYAEHVGIPAAHLPDPDKADWTVDELVDLAHEVLPEGEDGSE